jgi:hypothetical protein
MRALETHPKAIAWTIEIVICVVTAFRCSVKAYGTRLSTECYLITI